MVTAKLKHVPREIPSEMNADEKDKNSNQRNPSNLWTEAVGKNSLAVLGILCVENRFYSAKGRFKNAFFGRTRQLRAGEKIVTY